MRKRLIISLLVVAVIAVIVSLPRTAPQIISALPREDVTQITRAVRREMWREVLPDMSLYSISQLHSSLRRCWSEQITSIYAHGDGTVSVMTGRKKNGVWHFHGSAYLLKRGPKGWVITSRSSWISSSEESPDYRIGCPAGHSDHSQLVSNVEATGPEGLEETAEKNLRLVLFVAGYVLRAPRGEFREFIPAPQGVVLPEEHCPEQDCRRQSNRVQRDPAMTFCNSPTVIDASCNQLPRRRRDFAGQFCGKL